MRRIAIILFAGLLAILCACNYTKIQQCDPKDFHSPYFPDKIFSQNILKDKEISRFYSKHLSLLEEPAITKDNFEMYRLLYIKPNDSPISIRIQHKGGDYQLIHSQLGSYDPASHNGVLERATRNLTKDEIDKLHHLVANLHFQEMEKQEKLINYQDTIWIFETNIENTYTLIDQSAGSKDLAEVCHHLLKLP
jgi:hypothetical protein